jgi:hypothetical protein
MYDTSALSTTSSKNKLPWRETRLGFLLVGADGRITQAHTLDEKRALLNLCTANDRLLAIRMQQYPPRPEVLAVDDLDAARDALA